MPAVDLAIPGFGHKNHVAIDRQHGLIRTWTVSDAARHDGAQLIGLIDKTNTAASVWADMAYRSKRNEAWLATDGLRSCLHRRKPQGRPMPRRTALANAARSRSVRRCQARLRPTEGTHGSGRPNHRHRPPGQRRRSASLVSFTTCSVWSGSAREPRQDKQNARKRSPDNPADHRIRAINPTYPAQILQRQSSDPQTNPIRRFFEVSKSFYLPAPQLQPQNDTILHVNTVYRENMLRRVDQYAQLPSEWPFHDEQLSDLILTHPMPWAVPPQQISMCGDYVALVPTPPLEMGHGA